MGEAATAKVTCMGTRHISTCMQVYSLLIYEQFTTTTPEMHKHFVCKQKFFSVQYAIFHLNNVLPVKGLIYPYSAPHINGNNISDMHSSTNYQSTQFNAFIRSQLFHRSRHFFRTILFYIFHLFHASGHPVSHFPRVI